MPLQEETPSQPTEMEELFIDISVDHLAEPTVKLLPSSPAMRVPLSLSIRLFVDFSKANRFTRDQTSYGAKYNRLVFSRDDLPWYVACVLLELPLTAICLSWKPVSSAPPWFKYDTLMPVTRPPPWPN